mmetsp:Transcript_113177/g.200698  ORF Transcript_113177/g.200698 Transcript_113177/m.200698 type:complete len:274 (-) Transcript_113177:656-1477(-)
MCQSQREGSWATYNFASCVVLGAVARAHELVLSPVPWHHATQVCADSVESVIFDLLVLRNNEVGGIAPDTLDQLAGLCVILFQPSLKCDNISKCICSGHTCASTAFCWREEEGDVAKEAPPVWNRDGTKSEQVQDGPSLHVSDKIYLRPHDYITAPCCSAGDTLRSVEEHVNLVRLQRQHCETLGILLEKLVEICLHLLHLHLLLFTDTIGIKIIDCTHHRVLLLTFSPISPLVRAVLRFDAIEGALPLLDFAIPNSCPIGAPSHTKKADAWN